MQIGTRAAEARRLGGEVLFLLDLQRRMRLREIVEGVDLAPERVEVLARLAQLAGEASR